MCAYNSKPPIVRSHYCATFSCSLTTFQSSCVCDVQLCGFRIYRRLASMCCTGLRFCFVLVQHLHTVKFFSLDFCLIMNQCCMLYIVMTSVSHKQGYSLRCDKFFCKILRRVMSYNKNSQPDFWSEL